MSENNEPKVEKEELAVVHEFIDGFVNLLKLTGSLCDHLIAKKDK